MYRPFSFNKMVKIRIIIVFDFLFLAKVIESSMVTLCDNSTYRYQNLTCPENKAITGTFIRYGVFPCRDTNNNRLCHSIIDTYLNDNCLGKNNCTLPINILYNGGCQRPQRRLEVQYVCSSVQFKQCDRRTNKKCKGKSIQSPIRKSTRLKKKPARFEDESFTDPGDKTVLNDENRFYKVKRILARKIMDGTMSYLGHFIGEPAQNARWLQESDFDKKTRDLIKRRLPPQIL